MYETLIILLTIFTILILISISYILIYNSLKDQLTKVEEAEKSLDKAFKEKTNLMIVLKKIIIKETNLDEKMFKDVKNLKKHNRGPFNFYEELTKCNNLINRVESDHSKLIDNSDFAVNYEKLYKLNERLEASVIYYNLSAKELNNLITKFPSNLISRIHKINKREYYNKKK